MAGGLHLGPNSAVGGTGAGAPADRWPLAGEADSVTGSAFAWNTRAHLGYHTTIAGRATILSAGSPACAGDDDSSGFAVDVTRHGPMIGRTLRC